MLSRLLGDAPVVTRALFHAVWQGALLALIAALAMVALARRGAAVRHALGMACLLATAAVPVVTFVHLRAMAGAAARPSAGPMMLRGTDWLALVVPAVWLAGAGAMLIRQLVGWQLIGALERRGRGELPASWQHRVDVLGQALGIARGVRVLRAPDATTPFTARLRRPVIWIPAAVLGELPADQRDALLAHELAHVRRLDWLWNGLQCTIEAWLFFHPAVWWLSKQIRQDREHACDELAVATCGDPIALAEALAALEGRRSARPGLALAAQGGTLVQRVAYVLAPGSGAPRLRLRAMAGLLLALCGGGVLASRLDVPDDVLINLKVDASSTGRLAPGESREIAADALRARHHYRGRMDRQGHLHERYEQDGEARPIDPAARAWLDSLVTDTTR